MAAPATGLVVLCSLVTFNVLGLIEQKRGASFETLQGPQGLVGEPCPSP